MVSIAVLLDHRFEIGSMIHNAACNIAKPIELLCNCKEIHLPGATVLFVRISCPLPLALVSDLARGVIYMPE
jgi:hypothetical protein